MKTAVPQVDKSLVLAGIEAGRTLVGPETIHIDVTNACNATCIMCWDHSPLLRQPRAAEWKRRMVDPAAVKAILDDAIALGGLRRVILSGMGEPFVHPEIEGLILAVKSRSLRLTLISNLVAAGAADPQRLAALGVDQVLVSIHAATEATYQAIHPNFGGHEWAELIRRLDGLAKAGVEVKHVHAICAPNAEELPAMIVMGQRHKAAEVSFKLASLCGGTEACRISEEQRRRLMEETVPEAAALAAHIGVRSNLGLFARQLAAAGEAGRSSESTAPIDKVGCLVGYTYSRITVDGTVLFCCDAEMAVGKLGPDLRFSTLWNSPEWNQLRDRMRQGRFLTGCARCGKLSQNVKLGRQFAAAYGEARLKAVTGRDDGMDG